MSVIWSKSGGKAKIINIKIPYPSYVGTLAYNGKSQTPQWRYYDSKQITISGTYQAKNVGSYTAYFTPKTGYCWEDGTKTKISVVWSIEKGECKVQVNPNTINLSLSKDAEGVVYTVTWNSDQPRLGTYGYYGVTLTKLTSGVGSATFLIKPEFVTSNASFNPTVYATNNYKIGTAEITGVVTE